MSRRLMLCLSLTSGLVAQPLTPVDIKKRDALCAVDKATDEAEPAAAKAHSSPRLTMAKLSWNRLKAFLSDPATPYQDRIAAAYQGGHLVGVQDLPTLWTLLAAQAGQNWVKQQPCLWAYRISERPKENLPSYPATAEDRGRAPWQWQAARALEILNRQVQQRYYADPNLYRSMLPVAWRWQPVNDREAHYRYDALRNGPRNADRLRTLVRVALSDPLLGQVAPAELYVCCTDTFHIEELVHAAQLVILVNTKDVRTAALAAFWTAQLSGKMDWTNGGELKPMRTSSAVLAVARWAMDPGLDAWERYYSFAGPITQMVDHPPWKFDPHMSPDSPDVRIALAQFERWFQSQKSRLEREAAAEKPRLHQLSLELTAPWPDGWRVTP